MQKSFQTGIRAKILHVKDAKKIALFGGTFDPVHAGHLFIARSAYEQCALDLVIFLPCRHSPHKSTTTTATIQQRLEMLHLATADAPWMSVDDFDAVGSEPPYSYLTAGHFAEKFPEASLFWIMGCDQWNTLPEWKHPEILARDVTFLVFTRNEIPTEKEGYRMVALQGTHMASASAIRDNNSPDHLKKEWLHADVMDYINACSLYA
jgi:nicotinate-nucleotide adenylyltransferase